MSHRPARRGPMMHHAQVGGVAVAEVRERMAAWIDPVGKPEQMGAILGPTSKMGRRREKCRRERPNEILFVV